MRQSFKTNSVPQAIVWVQTWPLMCLPEDAVTDQWRVGIGDELWIWIPGLANVKLEMAIRPCRRSRFPGVQEPQLQGGTTEWTRGHLKDKDGSLFGLCPD